MLIAKLRRLVELKFAPAINESITDATTTTRMRFEVFVVSISVSSFRAIEECQAAMVRTTGS